MIILVYTASGQALAGSKADSQSQVTFYVHWFDVGKSALERLKGVKQVTSGFKGFKEINTVTYDPHQISITEMQKALKSARTYRGIVQ